MHDLVQLPTYGFSSFPTSQKGVNILNDDLSEFLSRLDLKEGGNEDIPSHNIPTGGAFRKPHNPSKPNLKLSFATPHDHSSVPANVEPIPSVPANVEPINIPSRDMGTPDLNPWLNDQDENRLPEPLTPTSSPRTTVPTVPAADSQELYNSVSESIQGYLLGLFPGGTGSELSRAHVGDVADVSRCIVNLDMDPKTRNLRSGISAILMQLPRALFLKETQVPVENSILEIIRGAWMDRQNATQSSQFNSLLPHPQSPPTIVRTTQQVPATPSNVAGVQTPVHTPINAEAKYGDPPDKVFRNSREFWRIKGFPAEPGETAWYVSSSKWKLRKPSEILDPTPRLGDLYVHRDTTSLDCRQVWLFVRDTEGDHIWKDLSITSELQNSNNSFQGITHPEHTHRYLKFHSVGKKEPSWVKFPGKKGKRRAE
ncbi:hypothetical protein Hypma_014667 [Hypsizygus marmoreus]|uniref:Uncharacterized protein n=1 Tax=Hypsizygus marmoreus TaxID=39966 RepID=A0A369JBX5_HYPMA|nr:hypothetical protein Hypma_014667 [Hypsizygus marmoreus]